VVFRSLDAVVSGNLDVRQWWGLDRTLPPGAPVSDLLWHVCMLL